MYILLLVVTVKTICFIVSVLCEKHTCSVQFRLQLSEKQSSLNGGLSLGPVRLRLIQGIVGKSKPFVFIL